MAKRVERDLLTYSGGGFPSLSIVGERYEIANALLCEVGRGVARTYRPFSEVDLPTALARISTKEITLLDFACEFGTLGFSRLVRAALLPSFSASLPKSAKWKTAHAAYRGYRDAVYAAARDLPEGDPVDWVLAHSRTVALCLEFIGLLAEGDEYPIRDAVEGTTGGPYAIGDRIVSLPVEEWREALNKSVVPSVIIRRPLCDLLTENIAGVRRWVITDPLGTHADSFFLNYAMIQAVYWQLADKMEAKMVRRCDECQRFFIARDKRQRYCPPLPGSTRSRCSSRLNVRNHRHRQG